MATRSDGALAPREACISGGGSAACTLLAAIARTIRSLWLTAGSLAGRQVDFASLVAFRFLFGCVMAVAMVRFLAKGWVRQLYIDPAFHFTYPGFGWVHPWPGPLMYAHFVALAVLALAVAFGIFYRVAITLFFLGFTYIELLDQTAYLNHYYLVSLLSGLLIFLPAHRACSFDAWRKPQIRLEQLPAWALGLLRFQVAVVYIFAGLAKFNADWLLRAQPLRVWLAARADLPLVGHWLAQTWVAYAASWFGAVFDVAIVFLLMFKRTRRLAWGLLVFFHVATWVLFNIGMFPWIMILAATLLLPPDWPRRWVAMPPFLNRPGVPPRWPLRLLLGAYVTVQLALPLRFYFYSEPPAWTGTGFNCAWQVMIAEKSGWAEFQALDADTGKDWKLSLRPYLTPRQEMMMAQDPDLIRAMARRLATDLERRGGGPVEINAVAFATLNGRPSQTLINPSVNLAATPRPGWIMPLAR